MRVHRDLEIPPRPYVPSAFAGAATACAVSALLLLRAWGRRCAGAACWVDVVAVAAVCLMGTALCALARALASRGFPQRACALRWVGAVGVVVAISSALWTGGLERSDAGLDGPASGYTFIVDSEPSVGSFGISCTARALDEHGVAVATVRLTAQERFEIADELKIVGRVEPLDESEWARSRFMKGEVASVDVIRVLERRPSAAFDPIGALRARILAVIDPTRSPARALLAGTVCGSASDLNQTAASDTFSATGLSHLVAVSGSHLALIASFVQQGLKHTSLRPRSRFVLVAAASVVYVLFTGCAASAVRSVIMVCLGMLALSGRRRTHGLSALCLTAVLFIAVEPGVVFDLGFQLSAMSVLFISVFGSYLSVLGARLRLPTAITEPLAVTIAAMWATLPLTVPIFGQLSLVAPLANLVVGQLMTVLLAVGIVIAPLVALVPPLGFLLIVPDAVANLSIFAAEAMAALPFASLAVAASMGQLAVLYALAVLLYLIWPDPSGTQVACCLLCALAPCMGWFAYWLYGAPPAITVLDVGQADAILLRDRSSCVLVDAGVDEQASRALARNCVYQLDAVVITHWDADHWGGLPDILSTVPVDTVYVAEGAAAQMPEDLAALLACETLELSAGDVLRVGGFSCTVVWPDGPVEGSENEDSLALDVEYRGGRSSFSALLTGDTEVEQELSYADEVGKVDVLKLGHHGSAASVGDELLERLGPLFAVASAGENNAYGHPDPACVDAVARSGARFACTKDVGDIVVEPYGSRFRVRTQGGSG